jgi:hypothetical protein
MSQFDCIEGGRADSKFMLECLNYFSDVNTNICNDVSSKSILVDDGKYYCNVNYE